MPMRDTLLNGCELSKELKLSIWNQKNERQSKEQAAIQNKDTRILPKTLCSALLGRSRA